MTQEIQDRDYEINHYRTLADEIVEKQQLAEKREAEAFDKLSEKEQESKKKDHEVEESKKQF